MDELIEAAVECPYCGESFSILVDASAGESDYIEDCVVCCQPIEYQLRFGAGGEPELVARRGDDNLF